MEYCVRMYRNRFTAPVLPLSEVLPPWPFNDPSHILISRHLACYLACWDGDERTTIVTTREPQRSRMWRHDCTAHFAQPNVDSSRT